MLFVGCCCSLVFVVNVARWLLMLMIYFALLLCVIVVLLLHVCCCCCRCRLSTWSYSCCWTLCESLPSPTVVVVTNCDCGRCFRHRSLACRCVCQWPRWWSGLGSGRWWARERTGFGSGRFWESRLSSRCRELLRVLKCLTLPVASSLLSGCWVLLKSRAVWHFFCENKKLLCAIHVVSIACEVLQRSL